MQDVESKTLWNHITGEALYGPFVGRNLGPVGNLLQLNVEQALVMDPAMQIAISDRPYFAGGKRFGATTGLGAGRNAAARASSGARRAGLRPAIDSEAQLGEIFVPTLGEEDDRRPRMDLGLGIFTATTRRYYPLESIRAQDGALIDELDGRKLMIFIDPDTYTPAALFVDASRARVEGKEIRLDDGAVLRSGALYGADGGALAAQRPPQLFTRWYGFALTFPDPEVFGE